MKEQICIYETYKNIDMPHGRHIYSKSASMEKATMCAYPQSEHALPHWKGVMQFCAKCASVNLPYQVIDYQYSDTSPSSSFHIYNIIARCTTHERLPLNEKFFSASVNRILLQKNQ